MVPGCYALYIYQPQQSIFLPVAMYVVESRHPRGKPTNQPDRQTDSRASND